MKEYNISFFLYSSNLLQGEDKLIEKIEKDYEELMQKNEDNDLDGIQGLLKLQKIIGEDLVSIINACLVNKDRRVDIIKLYISCYHENVVSSLRNYFKKNKDEFSVSLLILFR